MNWLIWTSGNYLIRASGNVVKTSWNLIGVSRDIGKPPRSTGYRRSEFAFAICHLRLFSQDLLNTSIVTGSYRDYMQVYRLRICPCRIDGPNLVRGSRRRNTGSFTRTDQLIGL